ncbi:MAG: hemolysin III family protein [Candidatus Sericytochromatia bacterium]|nr:hemolysin III family protein [Candidatus Sericytochromatia bacterium]
MATYFREPVNGLLHFSALLASLLATGFMLGLVAHEPAKLVTIGIYGLGMCLTFLASTAHHWVRSTPKRELLLLKLDHAAIYLFIAGTYTPIAWHLLPAPGRVYFLTVVWLIAVGGIVHKMLFFKTPADITDPPDRVSVILYVLMGWMIVFEISPLMQALHGEGLALVGVGGAFYTLGGLIVTTKAFDVAPGTFGHHELWHVLVIGGTACLYMFIFWHVLPVPPAPPLQRGFSSGSMTAGLEANPS